ncbi:GGDEF domain-containing protein [Sedimenticola sp.]|uniref:GGDEF domain-containing protein n=1 Tax=Sedimenticola sp. TaxID=1940285 RepID=UPI003D142463
MQYSLEEYLYRIIRERSLTVLFQPIVNNKKREIFGYEALIRGPSDTPLHSPVTLFETAARYGHLVELEVLCREVSIQQFVRLNLDGKLFLNTSPESLFQPNFRTGSTLDILKHVGLPPEKVVIELTEQFPTENYEAIREAKHHYKSMGFEIAIDDLGAGYAGLRMWSELRPDYVKIDRHFMQDIHEDRVKQEFVRSIKNIARGLNCKVVGEGVETADEFRCVAKLGIEFFQGYYFARPAQIPVTTLAKSAFTQTPHDLLQTNRRSFFTTTISDLLQSVPGIAATTSIEESAQIFQMAPQLESLPVVDNQQPLGLVRRNNLMNLLLTRYGRELHGKKPIVQCLDHNTLMLETSLPIEQASGLISEQMKQNKELEFIITENGSYLGVGSVIDLLKVITEMQVRSARYANPLTLLPGNVPIYEELDHLLREQQEFVVCYCDLDNFKPFNDKYGYEKGDQVIKDLADILRSEVKHEQDFIGHIGGDDFILIFQSDNWQTHCQAILRRFEEKAPVYYSREDISQQGIWSQDRVGKYRFFPLLTLSIGSVVPDPAACKSHHDVASLASCAKREAKQLQGNSLFIERRRRPNNPHLHHAVA